MTMSELLPQAQGPAVDAPLLITAATKWEAEPLARGLGLAADGAGRWRGVVGRRPAILVKTGMGAKAARDVLDAGFVAADYFMALSAGLCGALQPGVRRGDIVADAQDVELERVVALRETAAAMRLPFHFGRMLHTNIVLQPEAKRRLGAEHRAVACDMESAALRRWAQARTPVIAVRAVLDELDEALPDDPPRSEDAATLARWALSRPASLPGLIATGMRAARAMKTLSRFLKAYLEALP